MEEKIRDFYNDPETGLVGAQELHRRMKEKGFNYSLDQIKTALSNIEGYTLGKAIVRQFPRRRIISNFIDELWQADLVEMDVPQGAPASENDGIRYLLTIIDVFSKYAWVKPLKNKTGASVSKELSQVFKENHPEKLQTDEGNEFYNKECDALFKKLKINHYSSRSDYKAAVVERFNRTLKMRMARLFEFNQSHRYIDDLEDLVKSYNNSYHTAIKMTPKEARNKKNEDIVYKNLIGKTTPIEPPKLKVGDFVRIPAYKNTFTKEWTGKWTVEFFKITKIKPTNPVTYEIEDLKDEPIEGIYYEQELQKISDKSLDNTFRIDKVIKAGTGKQKGYAFVSYLGWPEKFNEWIPINDVKDLKKPKK